MEAERRNRNLHDSILLLQAPLVPGGANLGIQGKMAGGQIRGATTLLIVWAACVGAAQRVENVPGAIRYLVMVDGSASVSENAAKAEAARRAARLLTLALFDPDRSLVDGGMPQFRPSRGDRIDVFAYGLQKRGGADWTIQTLGSPSWRFPDDFVHLQGRFSGKTTSGQVQTAMIQASQRKFDLNLRSWVTSMGLWGARAGARDSFSRTYLLWMHDGALNGPGLVNEREVTLQYLGSNLRLLESAEVMTRNLVLRGRSRDEPILRKQFPHETGLVKAVALVYELVADDLGTDVRDLLGSDPFKGYRLAVRRGRVEVTMNRPTAGSGSAMDVGIRHGDAPNEQGQTRTLKAADADRTARFQIPRVGRDEPIRILVGLYASTSNPILGTRRVRVVHELQTKLPAPEEQTASQIGWMALLSLPLWAALAYLYGYVRILKGGSVYSIRASHDFRMALPSPRGPEEVVSIFCREPSILINLPSLWVRRLYLKDASIQVEDGGIATDLAGQRIASDRILLRDLRSRGLIVEWPEGKTGSVTLVPGDRKGAVSWKLQVGAKRPVSRAVGQGSKD